MRWRLQPCVMAGGGGQGQGGGAAAARRGAAPHPAGHLPRTRTRTRNRTRTPTPTLAPTPTPTLNPAPTRPPCSRRPRDPRVRRHPRRRPSWRPHRAARHAAPPSRAQAQYPSVALPRDHIYVRAKHLASRARHAVGCTGLSPTPWTWAPYACVCCVACRDRSTSSLAGTPTPPRSMVHRSRAVVPWFSPFTRGARLCAQLRAKPH